MSVVVVVVVVVVVISVDRWWTLCLETSGGTVTLTELNAIGGKWLHVPQITPINYAKLSPPG